MFIPYIQKLQLLYPHLQDTAIIFLHLLNQKLISAQIPVPEVELYLSDDLLLQYSSWFCLCSHLLLALFNARGAF